MKKNTATQTTQHIKKLVALAVFAAVAYVLHFIHIPVAFLNLDFKDVVMTVAGMYFGPLSGLVLAILVPLLEFPTGSTGVYGLIMNIISSATFVVVASLIYRFKRTLSGAIIALCAAALSMTAMMMLANLFVTPFYMGVSRTTVVTLIPTLLLPFNAVKAILNASLTLCLYKPMTSVLKRTGFAKPPLKTSAEQTGEISKNNTNTHLRTALVYLVGGTITIASLLVIFLVLGGSIAIN